MSPNEIVKKQQTPFHKKDHKRSIELVTNTQEEEGLREKSRTKTETNNNLQNLHSQSTVVQPYPQQQQQITNLGTNFVPVIRTGNNNTNNNMVPEKIRQLRLEAIFHPKFDNEQQNNQNVREQMKEKVSLGKGYLEVSLKHSGSLLLWSGGQRYYSKNSTDNYFCNAGEIVLRQHFYRAWHENENDNNNNNNNIIDKRAHMFEQAYRDCSDFITQHRLTLAFELVTSYLGHHGSLPHRDFLVLTAVADKNQERFYSTAELVALAQKFRLPHNDSWSCLSIDSVNSLFELYETTRETGLADDTCYSLTNLAEGHICSIYPHSTFQGTILEGIVIRYVPYHTLSNKEEQNKLRQLEIKSKDLLKDIPPEKPDCFVLVAENDKTSSSSSSSPSPPTPPPYLLTVNLRQVFRECFQAGVNVKDALSQFEGCLQDILNKSDGTKRQLRQSLSNNENDTKLKQQLQDSVEDDKDEGHQNEQSQDTTEINIPKLAKELLLEQETELDKETKRIAKTICSLEDIKGKATYKVYQEVGQSSNQDARWLCIIHVIHDNTFKTFQRHMEEGDMALYRGFSIELIPDTHPDSLEDSLQTEEVLELNDNQNGAIGKNDGSLMLKMKFLPYMVRTFGCRNGLRILKQSGPAGFERYVLNLMHKWGISTTGIAQWHPFFVAWANYAYTHIDNETMVVEANGNKHLNMLPLNSTFYLDHFETFNAKYQSNLQLFQEQKDTNDSSEGFSGTVIVAAPNKEVAETVTSFLAKKLGDIRNCNDVNTINEQDLIRSRLPSGGGLVCAYALTAGMKPRIRKILKGFHSSTSVVLVDCEKENIAAAMEESKDRNKLFGMIKGIRKVGFAAVLDLPSKSCTTSEDNSYSCSQLCLTFDKLWDISKAIEKPDMRPGMLFFFPSIPGSGKSTLCNPQLRKALENISREKNKSQSENNRKPRKIVLFEGDKIKEKYWQAVQRERSLQNSSIFIADKNVPPTSWAAVGECCMMSNGWAVPVLPDDRALATTSISGIRNSNGELTADTNHHYPFSLLFLAVCIARVLARPPNSHAGKLDKGTDNACMILIKFFSFYRNISASEFEDAIQTKLDSVGVGSCLKGAIRIPFFAPQKLPDIPSDLKDALIQALQVQFGCQKNRDGKATSYIQDLETSLRSLFETHKDFLHDLAVSKDVSQKALLSQISPLWDELIESESTNLFDESTKTRKIKLVSIDIDAKSVHGVLQSGSEENASLSAFLSTIANNGEHSDGGLYTGEGFITNTHVTMAHFKEMDQKAIHQSFDAIVGQSVSVNIKSFIWSEKVAALAVEVDTETEAEAKYTVPAPQNAFPHITVWHAKGANAFLSNQLLDMLESGRAERIDFSQPIKLRGTISFWDKNNKHLKPGNEKRPTRDAKRSTDS